MSKEKPNILIIHTDQLRGQIIENSQMYSPNLDRIVSEGTVFMNAYCSNPVCSPSRASLLTGKFSHAQGHGVRFNNIQLSKGNTTFANRLKENGYKTGYIGKWHLDGPQRPGFVPPNWRRHGFDYWAGFNRGHRYAGGTKARGYTYSTYYRDTPEPIQREEYEPNYQTDLAMDYMDRNQTDPFLLFLSWGPPHTPLKPPKQYLNIHSPEEIKLRPNIPGIETSRAREEIARYYDLVSSLDDNLGRLLEFLKDRQILENTAICFTSDHGDMLGSQGIYRKNVPFEESTKIPLVFFGQEEFQTGKKLDELVSNIDLPNTLTSIAGTNPPPETQGRDLLPLIRGENTEEDFESVYVQGRMEKSENEQWRMIRTRDYMLTAALNLTDPDVTIEPKYFFDMNKDPYQTENLENLKRNSEKIEELKSLIVEKSKEIEDPFCDRL